MKVQYILFSMLIIILGFLMAQCYYVRSTEHFGIIFPKSPSGTKKLKGESCSSSSSCMSSNCKNGKCA